MIGIRDVLRRLVEQAAEQHEGARDTARALLTRAPRNTTTEESPARWRILRACAGSPWSSSASSSRSRRRPTRRRPSRRSATTTACCSASAGDGPYPSPRDYGYLLTIGSSQRDARRSTLQDVSILGGRIRIARMFVPASGTRGAHIDGLQVARPLRAGDAEHRAPGRRRQLRRVPAGSRAAGTPRDGPRPRRRARRRRRPPDPRRARARRRGPGRAAARLVVAACSASRRSPRSAGRRSLTCRCCRRAAGPEHERSRSRSAFSASVTCGAARARSPASTARVS